MFDENMTANEARNAFYEAVKGKSKAEFERIKNEYFKVSSKIAEKELSGDPRALTNE